MGETVFLLVNKLFKIVCSGVFSLEAGGFWSKTLLLVTWLLTVVAEEETGGFTLREFERGGTVTEPEKDESDGDPGQGGESGGEVLAGVAGS